MRSPGPLFIVSSRGPRSNTHTAWPSPVRATTSTADIDLSHFHNYCYAERNRNTHACRVHTRVNAGLRDWLTIGVAYYLGQSNISALKCSCIRNQVTLRTRACCVGNRANTRSQDCERGTQECVRHNVSAPVLARLGRALQAGVMPLG